MHWWVSELILMLEYLLIEVFVILPAMQQGLSLGRCIRH
jgi:hypothetical protein